MKKSRVDSSRKDTDGAVLGPRFLLFDGWLDLMSSRGHSTATSVLSSKRSVKSRGLYILEILKA